MTSILADIRADIDGGQYNEINDDDGDGDVDREDLREYRSFALAFAGISLSSLAGGALFTWLLAKRMNARGRADRTLRGLEIERNVLKLKIDASVDASSANAQVTFAF